MPPDFTAETDSQGASSWSSKQKSWILAPNVVLDLYHPSKCNSILQIHQKALSLLSHLKCDSLVDPVISTRIHSHHHCTCHQPGLPPRKLCQSSPSPLSTLVLLRPAYLSDSIQISAPPSQSKIILMVPRITLGQRFQKFTLGPWLLQVQISS